MLPLDTKVNGNNVGSWAFVERAGELYATRDAFEEWRVQLPATSPIVVRSQEFWPLARVPGFTFKLNYATQSATIEFAPEAFFATKLTRELALPPPSPVLPSMFVNYDLNLQTSSSRGTAVQNDLGLLAEVGISQPWGVLTTSHVGRKLNDPSSPEAAWTRLETTFTRNDPERALTLRVGDSVTRTGLWGNAVYFGGVQLTKNFALQPGFLTQPLPVIGGVSAAPSTVQLYVNDVLRKVSDVQPGPFVIDNLAGVTGAGEARLVVRDVLGREVVIVQRYFTSSQLLAAGLSDWSIEAGSVRKDLGVESASYGQSFTSGTWRRGVSDALTIEGRGEFSPGQSTTGFGSIAALPFESLGRAALSLSNHGQGTGRKVSLGVEKQWVASSLYAQAQFADRPYRELGRDTPPPRAEFVVNGGLDIGVRGRLSLGFAGVRPFDAPPITTLSTNYVVPLPRRATLAVTLSRAIGNSANSGLFAGASVTLPIGETRNMQAATSGHGATHDRYVSVNQSSTPTSDFGWRLLTGQLQNQDHAEGGLFYGGRFGRVYSDVSASPGQWTLRSGASGGLVLVANRAFATRRVDQSFAIVEVPGYKDVGVGLGSAVTTATDEGGIALVPYLAPYQVNQVRLNATDLPISAELDSLEQQVVPSWRSAVKVSFPVRAGRAALLRIQLDDGEAAPPGAVVRIDGDAQEFYVARRGEAYVTGLSAASKVRLAWKEQSCVFEVPLGDATNDEVFRTGPIRCKGVQR